MLIMNYHSFVMTINLFKFLKKCIKKNSEVRRGPPDGNCPPLPNGTHRLWLHDLESNVP